MVSQASIENFEKKVSIYTTLTTTVFMPEPFNAGKVDWERFFDVVVGLIETTTEAIVAEIVDNSIDHQASNIQVELSGRNRSDFHIVIYDDGVGFDNAKNLERSFDLVVENIGKQEKIGKFHIGMKLTPLSNCQTVSVFQKPKTILFIVQLIEKKSMKQKNTVQQVIFVPETFTLQSRKNCQPVTLQLL